MQPLVLLFYRHFARFVPGMSHIGLGNNALFSARVLRQHGIRAYPVGVNTPAHVRQALAEHDGCTHAVVEGTWLKAADLELLAGAYPQIEWAVREHSQVGFLQAQKDATGLFRDYGYLQERCLNFALQANSQRFSSWWQEAYDQPCLYLPNLYPTGGRPATQRRRADVRNVLRVSAYGAQRVLKNLPTAAAAALVLARRLGRQVELHVNVGREGGEAKITQTLRDLLRSVPYARLVEDSWRAWSEFRHQCAAMDVALAPTFSETFCLTAADHVCAGVPVCGTAAIEWLPKNWQAHADDAEAVAEVARSLVLDPHANQSGWHALQAYQADALQRWLAWLRGDRTNPLTA